MRCFPVLRFKVMSFPCLSVSAVDDSYPAASVRLGLGETERYWPLRPHSKDISQEPFLSSRRTVTPWTAFTDAPSEGPTFRGQPDCSQGLVKKRHCHILALSESQMVSIARSSRLSPSRIFNLNFSPLDNCHGLPVLLFTTRTQLVLSFSRTKEPKDTTWTSHNGLDSAFDLFSQIVSLFLAVADEDGEGATGLGRSQPSGHYLYHFPGFQPDRLDLCSRTIPWISHRQPPPGRPETGHTGTYGPQCTGFSATHLGFPFSLSLVPGFSDSLSFSRDRNNRTLAAARS